MQIDRRIDELEREVLEKMVSVGQVAIDTVKQGVPADLFLSQLDILEWLQERIAQSKLARSESYPSKEEMRAIDFQRPLSRLELAVVEKGMVILRKKERGVIDQGWLQALSWFFCLVLEVMEQQADIRAPDVP